LTPTLAEPKLGWLSPFLFRVGLKSPENPSPSIDKYEASKN